MSVRTATRSDGHLLRDSKQDAQTASIVIMPVRASTTRYKTQAYQYRTNTLTCDCSPYLVNGEVFK